MNWKLKVYTFFYKYFIWVLFIFSMFLVIVMTEGMVNELNQTSADTSSLFGMMVLGIGSVILALFLTVIGHWLLNSIFIEMGNIQISFPSNHVFPKFNIFFSKQCYSCDRNIVREFYFEIIPKGNAPSVRAICTNCASDTEEAYDQYVQARKESRPKAPPKAPIGKTGKTG